MTAEEKIALQCPECGAQMKTAPAMANAEHPCPGCGKTVRFLPADQSPAPAGHRGRAVPCPDCGAELRPEAVVCASCGRHIRSGLNVRTAAKAKGTGVFGLELALGAGAAVVGGVIWAVVVVATGYELGFLAWGIGLLAGLAVTLGTRERSARVGASAAGLAVLGLLIGKLLMVQWAAAPQLADEMMKNPECMAGVTYLELVEAGEVDGDLIEWMERSGEDEEPPAHLQPRIDELREKVVASMNDLAEMSESERRAAAEEKARRLVASMSYAERIKTQLSGFDVIWFLFAIVSAFKLGAGGWGRN